MKKFAVLIITFLLSTSFVFAKHSSNPVKMPSIKFGGEKYSLYFSAKDSEAGSYINEYYKKNQSYNNWNELIGVHHYPNDYSPIDKAQELKKYLDSQSVTCFSDISEKHNSAIMYFIVKNDKKLPILLEYNIFNFIKNPCCGTTAIQYVKRYIANNALDAEYLTPKVFKKNKKYIKKIKKLKQPEIITEKIEKGVYVSTEVIDEHNEDYE